MSTTDHLVSTDLAALGVESSRNIPSLDAAMTALAPAAPATAASITDPVEILALDRAFARLIARACAGAIAYALAVTMLIAFSVGRVQPTVFDQDYYEYDYVIDAVFGLRHAGVWVYTTWSIVLVVMAYGVGRVIAQTVVSRRARTGALDVVRTWTGRFDRDVTAIVIAGATALLIVLGVFGLVSGSSPWMPYRSERPEHNVVMARLAVLYAVVPACLYAAFLVTRRPRIPSAWVVLPIGIAISIATFVIGFQLDVGLHSVRNPSNTLRNGLTVANSIAVFMIVSNMLLRRRATRV